MSSKSEINANLERLDGLMVLRFDLQDGFWVANKESKTSREYLLLDADSTVLYLQWMIYKYKKSSFEKIVTRKNGNRCE